MDVVQQGVVGDDHGLAHPDQGDKQHQSLQSHPDDEGVAETPFRVDPENVAEEQEAQHAPRDEQEVGLARHGASEQKVGKQNVRAKGEHEPEAECSRKANRPVPVLLGQLRRGGGDQGVDQRGADGCDVHDPSDGGSADQRDQKRDGDNQAHGIGRNMPAVELGKLLRQDVVPTQREEQTAQGKGVSDEAGDDQTQQRQHQGPDAEAAEVAVRGIEGRQRLKALEVVQVPDVGEPAVVALGIGRHRQQRYHHVKHQRHHHDHKHQPRDPPVVKAEFLHAVGDAFKADEGPG